MSAILRASGRDFDVDNFVVFTPWKVAKIFRRTNTSELRIKGKQRKPSLNIVVSEAGFHQFDSQIKDAIAFLQSSQQEIHRLTSFPGVSGVEIDFGIAWRNVAAQYDHFPVELVRLAGASGIALTLSHYPLNKG